MESKLQGFKPASSKSANNGRKGGVTIVNAETGKRVAINHKIREKLGIKTKIQIAFSDTEIALSEKLPNNENNFNVKSSGSIYSSELVSEITDIYNLDFDNKTSITFSEISYKEIDGYNVALVKIR